MTVWDVQAESYLDGVVTSLRQSGAAGLIEQQVAQVFRRNADAFDHQHGDTPLSLGLTCSENIRELVLRACRGAESAWRDAGLDARTVDGSLQILAGAHRIASMKAPSSHHRLPSWNSASFNWAQGDSGVRAQAALRNRQAYWPGASEQDNSELMLDATGHPEGSADQVRDFLMVWSGELDSGLTAGWLTIPTLGPNYFYAAARLWWHDGTTGAGGLDRRDDTPPAPRPYDDQDIPEPRVRLRRDPDRSADASA